jgi:crotonobetainyl-CoA:carnitine CoA-transferase CaiB-like acyl-CoA transferase
MQPMAVDVDGAHAALPFPPRYGEHTRRVLAEAGMAADEIDALAADGVVAVADTATAPPAPRAPPPAA